MLSIQTRYQKWQLPLLSPPAFKFNLYSRISEIARLNSFPQTIALSGGAVRWNAKRPHCLTQRNTKGGKPDRSTSPLSSQSHLLQSSPTPFEPYFMRPDALQIKEVLMSVQQEVRTHIVSPVSLPSLLVQPLCQLLFLTHTNFFQSLSLNFSKGYWKSG